MLLLIHIFTIKKGNDIMKKEFLEKNGTFIVEYDIKDSLYGKIISRRVCN